jgi:hypothetical protein
MKKTLLFIALIASSTFFAQTNLVLNGSCDEHTGNNGSSTTDNADAWDMTPNSTIINESGVEIDSPYRAIWNNTDLDSWLGDNTGDTNDQPGSTSDGNWDYSAGADAGVKTRGVKLYSVGRRLYQVVQVTAGKEYTFSMDSRSEAENVPSEVFILNTEITTEAGLTSTSSTVDGYKNITNDFNSSKSDASTNNFTTSTIDFTATGTKVVIYVRASAAINSDTEVFYDNISLIEKATASTKDVFAANFSVFPNPANDVLNISSVKTIEKAEIYNLIGKKVISTTRLTNNSINISSLAKGVYILKLVSGDVVGTRKIIKE